MLDQEAAQSLEKISGADFLVRIIFRQNASWQGEVQWLNTGQKKRFRSFLELAIMMNRCLDESAYPRGGQSPRSWDSPTEPDRKDGMSKS